MNLYYSLQRAVSQTKAGIKAIDVDPLRGVSKFDAEGRSVNRSGRILFISQLSLVNSTIKAGLLKKASNDHHSVKKIL